MHSDRRLLFWGLLTISLLPSLGQPIELQPRRGTDVFVCGTGPERLRDALARGRYHESRLRRNFAAEGDKTVSSPATPAVRHDVGDVAVMEDDGTMITQPNPFDLSGKSFRFQAQASGSYLVVPTSSSFNSAGGTPVILGDDDSFHLSLSNRFVFYGKGYDSVQVNSDGNLTFSQPDASSEDRNLGRFISGPPRIGPFFSDLNPIQGGTISYRNETDGIVIVWSGVPAYSDTIPSQFNSFSVKLFQTGDIEFAYGARVDTQVAVVGISPGGGQGEISALDYTVDLPTQTPSAGTIAEVFAVTASVIETMVARSFFQTHPDSFDHLNLFLGFNYDLGNNAYAYELPVKNEIQGIGDHLPDTPATYDYSNFYGSNGRLRSFLNMGTLTGTPINFRYPDDPNQVFFNGTNSTMGIMGQESGHRWEAFTKFRDGNVNSTAILGRDLAHWSFFFNSEGSVMEGNAIQDTGAGRGSSRFVTGIATSTYSRLDQYIMGLIPKESVPPMFLVVNPVGTSRSPGSAPAVAGVVFGGDRKDFTIDSIIAANGPRIPSSDQAPKVFRQGFIYLTQKGQAADPAQISKVQRIRDAWIGFFNQQTGKRGWIVTNLQESPATAPAQILFPYFQANTNRYTGIAVANWGSTPADVLFTAYDNSGSPLSAPPGIINPKMMTIPAGTQLAVFGEQIFGLNLNDPHNGWIQAQSTSSQVTSFFLDGDSGQTVLSGSVASDRTYTSLYFARAQVSSTSSPANSYRNLINVINPDPTISAQLSIRLIDPSGIVRGTATRTLAPRGRLAEDMTRLFPESAAPQDGYLSFTSNTGVAGYQSIDTGSTIFSLPAMPASAVSQLYSAQFASGLAGGQRCFSELNLINTSAQLRNVRILLVGNDGTPVSGILNPINIPPLVPGQQYRARGEAIFQLEDAARASGIVEGSLVITADGPGVIGDLTFGDPVAGKFLASFPLDASPASNVILSQVAEGSAGASKRFFTGIAMYNPGTNDVSIAIDVYSNEGAKTGSATIPLLHGGRISKTLPQLVPAVQEQIGGYIRISVSGGAIVCYELFGTQALDLLAAVPAQAIIP